MEVFACISDSPERRILGGSHGHFTHDRGYPLEKGFSHYGDR